jgi:hypothetical protein
MEKEDNGFSAFIGSFRKVYATIPEQLFIKLQDSGVLRPGKFDTFVTQALYEKFMSIGAVEDTGSAKKPRKKEIVAEDEAV